MEHIIQQLKKYKTLKAEIKDLELDIEELHDSNNIGPAGVSYEEHTGITNKFNSQTENEAVRLADKTTQLEKDKRVKEREVERIENALSVLNKTERKVVELKYIDCVQWYVVAAEVDKDPRHCRRISTYALNKMAKFF